MIVDYHMHTPLCKHAVGEPEAYARLRRTAMNEGLTVAEVAQRLLERGDLLG